MLIEQFITDQDAQIALWDITEDRDQLFEMFSLDPYIMEQTFTFTSDKRQLEYLAVRALLKQIIGKPQTILYKPNRVPYLESGTHQISITHTGHYAAIILHATNNVGIDVERIGDKVVRVQNKFLSPEELQSIDQNNEKTHLTILWAAKEAIYKAMQIEVVDFAKDLHTEPFTPHLEGVILAKETRTKQEKHFVINYKVYPEFVMAWTIDEYSE